MEQAQASHIYSYKHGFRGFAAKLTDQQASQIAGKFGAIPNPNIAKPLLEKSFFQLHFISESDISIFKMTEMPGVVSVFPNMKRRLHTTHSWDFMGLMGEETMEIPEFSTKNQVNIIVGFIDTGR